MARSSLVVLVGAVLAGAVLTAPVLHAQGFGSFNGRNHPELEWQVAETEHFEIMYPARLAGIEVEAAPIAEASYDALSQNLGVAFDRRIRIYLSDEDEIANGFAMPFGGGFTNIWVHVNDVEGAWTGREAWLRRVIAHELAHIFHYRAVDLRTGPLGWLFGDPLPRFWTEGVAQYETEAWDAQRGDRWLRTAVLDDRLSYRDNRSIWNGRLLYAVGNAQVRYFAEQYGDSTLRRMLAHRDTVLFGLLRVHDFGEAFREVAGTSYRAFYDDWRRHVNVYYNTLAGGMENPDSLGVDPLELPGQYYYDVRYGPDTSRAAVLALTSLRRPVRRLYVADRASGRSRIVAEGAIRAPVAWSPDGERLAFARLTRGRFGSLLNDLFLVDADGGDPVRLTHSRRAASPAFSPDGRRLAFIASDGGTADVYVLDLGSGEERRVTRFPEGTQLLSLRWHPTAERAAVARFLPDGRRDVAVVDLASGAVEPLTSGAHDDRDPVWSPDGARLAYTSLRDDVPNVFVHDAATDSHRRVTFLATGASVVDWLPADSVHASGRLVVVSNVEKSRDHAYRLDAERTAPALDPQVPAAYAGWTTHRPPARVPRVLAPDPGLILARRPYRSWRNLTHASSFALPYYGGPGDWGLAGFTAWMEPLGKHLFALFGGVSVPSPAANSYVAATYLNRQWYPTLGLSLYRFPGSARVYGNDLLVENFAGGDVTATWPLDWRSRPYLGTTLTARVRYVRFDPLDLESFDEASFDPAGVLPLPEAGEQADLTLTFTRRKQRPYADAVVHPLDGWGVRTQLTGAARLLGADTEFLRADVGAYRILPSVGLHRVLAYGRFRAQEGRVLAQHFLGLSGRDGLQVELPGGVPLDLGDVERVRGYDRYVLGDRVFFGSLEYRVPLLPSLQTRLLGLVDLGATTAAAFADGGVVWSGAAVGDAVERLGVGVELKNALRLGGLLTFAHAVGVARPVLDAEGDGYELYYRIRTAVPF